VTYFVFAGAFFRRSTQRFFISSDSFLRPAALSLLARFAPAALLLDALLVRRLACLFELDPVRMLRAEVSLAISASISFTILAVSKVVSSAICLRVLAYIFIAEGAGKRGAWKLEIVLKPRGLRKFSRSALDGQN